MIAWLIETFTRKCVGRILLANGSVHFEPYLKACKLEYKIPLAT